MRGVVTEQAPGALQVDSSALPKRLESRRQALQVSGCDPFTGSSMRGAGRALRGQGRRGRLPGMPACLSELLPRDHGTLQSRGRAAETAKGCASQPAVARWRQRQRRHVCAGSTTAAAPHSPSLQARSLANTLNVVRRRLAQLQGEKAHTKEDLEHFKVPHVGLATNWALPCNLALSVVCANQQLTPRVALLPPATAGRGSTTPDCAAVLCLLCPASRRCWTTLTRAGGMRRAPLQASISHLPGQQCWTDACCSPSEPMYRCLCQLHCSLAGAPPRGRQCMRRQLQLLAHSGAAAPHRNAPGKLAEADAKTAGLCSRLFNECYGASRVQAHVCLCGGAQGGAMSAPAPMDGWVSQSRAAASQVGLQLLDSHMLQTS